MEINAISLCDGHSCGRLILEQLDFRVKNYLRSEIKLYADIISATHFPMSKDLGDMTQITEQDIIDLSFKVHVLISGTPCQSHSRNGKHGGFEDPRGELFYDFVHILEWIRKHNNPDVIFFFENVQMKKKSVELISESLGVEVIKLDSTYFSSQTRLRYYWTNLSVNEVNKVRQYTLRNILQEDIDHKWFSFEELNEKFSSKPVTIKSQKKVNGVPIWETHSEKFLDFVDGEMRARNGTKLGYVVLEDYDTMSTSFPNSTTRRGRHQHHRFATLDVSCSQMVYVNGMFRYPTITELERAQGLPDGYTYGVSMTSRKNLIGEGWQIDTVKFLLQNLKDAIAE